MAIKFKQPTAWCAISMLHTSFMSHTKWMTHKKYALLFCSKGSLIFVGGEIIIMYQ